MEKGNGYKSLVNTILTSGVAVVLSYLINFFLTPFITDTIGTESYGYITLAKTMVSYASIITVGFTAFMVRYITLEYHKKNYKECRAYFSSSVGAVVVISAAILVVAGIGIMFIDKWLMVLPNMVNSIRVLFFLVFLNFCFTTCAVPYTATCYIKNKLSIYNTLKIASYCIEAIILFLLFSNLPTEIWYVGIGLLATSLIIFIGSIIITQRLTPELVFDRQLVSISKVKNLASNGVWQSVNSLGNVLNSGLDLLITNQMLSTLAMGQLSIAKTIGSMFSILYSTVSQAFQPRMMKAYASENKQDFLGELRLAMRVSGFFSGCGFAGFLALGTLYYKLWIPNQDFSFIFNLTVVTILCSVAEGVIIPAYFVNTLTTKKRIPCLVTVGSGLANVLGMYSLIKYTSLGVFAVVWTTAVLSFLTNMVFNPIYCSVTLKLPWYTLYPTILKHILGCSIMCFVYKILSELINPTGWIGLIGTAILCCIVGVVFYFMISANAQEKRAVISKLRKKVHL